MKLTRTTYGKHVKMNEKYRWEPKIQGTRNSWKIYGIIRKANGIEKPIAVERAIKLTLQKLVDLLSESEF